MSFELIINSIRQFISIDDRELELFLGKLKVKEYGRKTLIQSEGQVCQNIYFVNKGSIRYYFNNQGKEVIGQFFLDGEWYTDYLSFLNGAPSLQFIETIEKTELLILSKSDMEALFDEVPKFERFGRLMAEQAYLSHSHRTKMMLNLDAEKRYLQLLKERPQLLQRIPQHYVASFLGIQPQSLSRIRKKIAGLKK